MLAGLSLGAVHKESRAGRMASTNQVVTEGRSYSVNIITYARPGEGRQPADEDANDAQ